MSSTNKWTSHISATILDDNNLSDFEGIAGTHVNVLQTPRTNNIEEHIPANWKGIEIYPVYMVKLSELSISQMLRAAQSLMEMQRRKKKDYNNKTLIRLARHLILRLQNAGNGG